MSITYDFAEVQAAFNQWKKKNKDKANPANGFYTHNFAAYGFKTDQGLGRRYRRDLIKLKELPPPDPMPTPPTKKVGTRGVLPPEFWSLQTVKQAKYGSLPPTLHREKIDTLDQLVAWIQKYTPYMRNGPQGNWDNANTRENARVLFFEVFKQGKSKLLGKPRDSGKSKVAVAVFCCILVNYYYPQSIIINGRKAHLRIYNGIARVILNSAQFRLDYGDVISSRNRNEGYMEFHPYIVEDLLLRTGYVTDDPAIQISVYSGIVGAHPFVVWMEDILQSIYKTPESNEYLLNEVFDAIIAKLADRIGGTFTRKAMLDIYIQLPTRNIMLLVRGAIEKLKGNWPRVSDLIYDPLEPERVIDINIPTGSHFKIIERPGWTVKSLLIMRTIALKDPRSFEMFEREMQNNPIVSEGLYFKGLKIPEVEPFTRGELAHSTYMVIDPASGKSAASSDTCFHIIGLFQGKFYIIETIIQKFNDTELLREARRLHGIYKPLMSFGENDFQQLSKNSTLIKGLRKLRGFGVFYNKGYGEKFARIDQLHPPLSDDLFRIYATATDKTTLLNQLREYNQRKAKLDGLDNLASAFRILEPKLNSSDNEFRIVKL